MSFSAIGRWWQKNEEIDLVALDEESNSIWFGECKWSVNPVGENVFRDLRRKAALVQWGMERRQERFMLFSRSGFTERMKEVAESDNVILIS